MKKLLYLATLVLTGLSVKAQIVNIPDVALKARLVGTNCASLDSAQPENFNHNVDANGDGEVQLTEVANVYGLSLSTATNTTTGDITSIEGLQYFTNLKVLFCDGNNIPTADFTPLIHLEKLGFDYNHTSSLNINGISSLQLLYCYYNSLDALDLSGLGQLATLACFNNNLTTLDLTGLNSLTHVECNNNQIASMTIPVLPQMSSFSFPGNQMTTFDLHVFPNAISVDGSNNPIATVNLAGLPNLQELNVSNTLVPQIDASQSGISRLFCNDNPNLTYINVQNGVFSGGDPDLLDYPFHFYNLPQLTGVCVDLSEEQWMSSAGVDLNAVPIYYGPNCSGNPFNAYNTVSGTFTFDAAGDGCGAGDSAMMGVTTQMNIGGTSNYWNFSNTSGQYSVTTAQNQLTITPLALNPDYFTFSPPSYTYDFTDTGNSYTADFCVTPNGVHPDLMVYLTPTSAARPGFDASYSVMLRNRGNQIQSGTVALNFDDTVLDYVSSTQTPQSQSANMLTWDFTGLQPYETRQIGLWMNLNSPMETPPLNLGDHLPYTVTVDSAQADENPADNSHTISQLVTNSFDPNEKYVAEGDKIDISQVTDYLHYTVVFQNTGSADAINVSINDMLAENLDPSTLEVVSSSHPCRATLSAGNRLDFSFMNINLPPASVNEPGSHGFVTFRIKPKNTVVVDDVIENTASIYFDFNFPIVTNTVATTVSVLGNSGFNAGGFSLYPNPVKNTLHIDLKENDNFKGVFICNPLGQLVKTVTDLDGTAATVDISDLVSGTYFVQVVSDKGKSTKKLIKI